MIEITAGRFAGMLLVILDYFPCLASQRVLTPESKRNMLMEKRFSLSLAALREKDDIKTGIMLRTMTKDFILEMEKLKPSYQKWYRSLSPEEKKRMFNASITKTWFLLMQEIQSDELILERLRRDPALKQEYERLQFQCDRAAILQVSQR